MATEQKTQQRGRRRGGDRRPGHADRHRQPDRRELRARGHRRDGSRDGPARDQGLGRRLRPDVLRPGVHEHGLVPLGDHVHRRRGRHPAAPRLPDRAALRALQLPGGRLPADLRRAAHQGAARALGLRRHPPHLRPRGHQEPLRDLPLRRAPDGDAAVGCRRALDLLSGGQAHRRPGGALHGGDQVDRQGPNARGIRLPPQPRAALRLSGQRARLREQLPVDAVQEDGGFATRPTRG